MRGQRIPQRRLVRALAVPVVTALLLVGCGDDGNEADGSGNEAAAAPSIAEPWSREPAAGQTVSAVYGVVSNPGDADITIVAATSPVTDTVELHETMMDDEGVMSMREKEDGFVVPAGEDFTFEPGGPHIMMLGIDPADYPDPVEVTLEFDGADPLTFGAEVRALDGDAGMDDGDVDEMDSGDMDETDSEEMDEGG